MTLSGFKKYFANTSWAVGNYFLRALCGFGISILLARYLGPGRYGMINYANALLAFGAAIVPLGLDSIVIRDLINKHYSNFQLLGTTFVLKLLASLVWVAFSYFLVSFLHPDNTLVIALTAIIALSTVFQAFDTFDFWFQSQVASKYTTLAQVFALVLITLIEIGLILMHASVVAFAWTTSLQVLLAGLLMLFLYSMKYSGLAQWSFSWRLAKELIKKSYLLIFQGLLIIVYMRIDQLMIAQMVGFDQTAQYSVAVNLAQGWYFIPVAISASLYPAIIHLKAGEPKHYLARIQQLYNLMIWLAIAGALSITLLAHPIIITLYGQQYAVAAKILSLQAWMAVAVFFGISQQKWLLAENKVAVGFQIELVGALLNIFLNLLFIRHYGAVGAAVASLISAFGSNFIVAMYSPLIRFSMKMYFKSLLFPLLWMYKKCVA
ncbi:MAG: polysaccharide biosynthesis protein [Gammaproteobacteria bacterium]|jgi:PST family polysaccharide transporter|nr:polysaccharide biosynthesis protein [Gammaproteobacteria bacterium]